MEVIQAKNSNVVNIGIEQAKLF